MAKIIKVEMGRFSTRYINLDQVAHIEEESHRNEENPDGTEIYMLRWGNGQIEQITKKPFEQLKQAISNSIIAPKKGYVVVTEESREGEETTVRVSDDVYTDFNDAYKEFSDIIEDAKTNKEGDYDWLAITLEEQPEHIVENWITGRYVSFYDNYGADSLNVYIHEVNIK